jgi:tetratricopeptide (TPR) repeat protein
MRNVRIERDQFADSLVKEIADRDAVLWIGEGLDTSTEAVEDIRRLIGFPWKLVLCEANHADLINAIESANATREVLNRQRGFIQLIASDPEGVQLPPRALPVFLLNGRENPREPAESPNLGTFASMRRRLNMLHELVAARPRMAVLVSNGTEQPISDFLTLWRQEGLRSIVVLLSTAARDAERIDVWLNEPGAAPAVDHCRRPLNEVVSYLAERLAVELPDLRLIIRIRDAKGAYFEHDITECEMVERPLLESYELIQSSNLRLLQPNDLTQQELEGFFNRSTSGWKPYAAGLPWRRSTESWKRVYEALKAVAQSGASENRVLTIVSESGAGGTTLARMLAFEAALQGYPTLVARQALAQPDVVELSRFLYRVHAAEVARDKPRSESKEQPTDDADAFEAPWLVVFDVGHWQGRHLELRNFVKALRHDGRPVVVLAVTSPYVPADFSRDFRIKQIGWVRHELTLAEALQLGEHLNRFLRPFGKQRTENQWRGFWEAHRPDHITASIAHFWIALEFWLKGQVDLNQSIQSWLYHSFQVSDMPDDVRLLLLEIAALTVERQPLPEGLMPLCPSQQRPYSFVLEEVRSALPALALARESTGTHKLWAMAHDLLGRYLINSTFFDHTMMERLKLTSAQDPVALRLLLLRRIACRSDLALKPFRGLALDFAIKILKLDADGNQEFVPHWATVLDILRAMPAGIRETSRAFNHHVAISLRRVAKQREFGIALPERQRVLHEAVGHLEYALNELEPSADEESDLNLYNSLALAYQDLADVEREAESPSDLISALQVKATEATRKAIEQDPTNSYVLETAAKNLIQKAELYPNEAVLSATEALGYIYQAVTLERSEFRQSELTRLANRALRLLRSDRGVAQVQKLTESGNVLGTLAQAWLVLTEGIADLAQQELTDMPAGNLSSAIVILENAAQSSNWMLLRFRYDLVCVSRPSDFASQLRLLDELEGTGYRMPLQVQLEHAILLHQQGRHVEGSRAFRGLRQELLTLDTYVEVPTRLYWLQTVGGGSRRICEARAVESRGLRSVAKVREIQEEMVPFVPQEFGVQSMRPGASFRCWITFGRMGPFLKPPQASTAS